MFNYIVPIFNKEKIISDVIESITRIASSKSRIICVVDGCTDSTESIVDFWISNDKRIEKILMPNVHMLKSVNAGLRLVDEGFCVICQDDIIFRDPLFEEKIRDKYRDNPRLGMVSLCMGSEISYTSLWDRFRFRYKNTLIKEVNFIQSPFNFGKHRVVDKDEFIIVQNAINGPNVIPHKLLVENGLFDEELAPYGYDDPELCLRLIDSGYVNAVYALEYFSDETWGGTRNSKEFIIERENIHRRNRSYIYIKHRNLLKRISKKFNENVAQNKN